MNNKILIAAFAGLSLLAAAQSQTDKQKAQPAAAQTQSPRDLSTGHASGKTMAHDDWHQQNAVSNGTPASVRPVASSSDTKAPSRVATGDVNGDGAANAAASRSSAHATEALSVTPTSTSKGQSPRDIATGQASGKRQHQPISISKPAGKTPNQ